MCIKPWVTKMSDESDKPDAWGYVQIIQESDASLNAQM